MIDKKRKMYKDWLSAFAAFSIVFVVFVIIPILVQGVEYELLAPIPVGEGRTQATSADPKTYIEGIVTLVIAIAGVLAVLKIIFAGIKYMSTDAFSGKTEAKGDIQNAIWGLALALSAWLILSTVNPNLTKLNLEIPGLEIGKEFDTDLGTLPTREEIDADKEREGCPNCAAVFPETGLSIRPVFGTMHPKLPGAGCAAGMTACLVDVDLIKKLQNLTKAIQDKAGYNPAEDPTNDKNEIEWQVTEMYPPTRPHQHACHNPKTEVTAMCVDASLKNLDCANDSVCEAKKGFLGATVTHTERLLNDAKKIRVFIEEANKLGLSVVYEVETDERLEQLQNTSILSPLKSHLSAPKYKSGPKAGYSAISGEHFSVYLNYGVRIYTEPQEPDKNR